MNVFFQSSTYFTLYRGGQWVLLQRNYANPGSNIFRGPGVQLFTGGGWGGGGGVVMLISIEFNLTCICDPPPDPHMNVIND